MKLLTNNSQDTLNPSSSPGLATESPTLVERLLERDFIPDWLIRLVIRRICAARLREQQAGGVAQQARRREQFIAQLKRSPIALHTEDANAQHYEVPAEFFQWVLVKRLKYS
jgi:cyclopropane-fatty-acyl-phospholipid synthase